MGMEEAFPGWNAKRAEEEAARVAEAEARRAAARERFAASPLGRIIAPLRRVRWRALFYIFVVAPLVVWAVFVSVIVLGATLALVMDIPMATAGFVSLIIIGITLVIVLGIALAIIY